MAEAPPTTRVRMEMWKQLCCSSRTKVQDQANAQEAVQQKKKDVPVTKQPGTKDEEVALFISPQLLNRGLLGIIVKSLERKQLRVVQMELRLVKKADLDKLFKSRKLKHSQDEKAPSLLLSVTGDDVIRRVAESCADVGKQHALTKLDLVWSTSAKEAKKDIALLFPPRSTFVIPPSPLGNVAADEAAEASAPPVDSMEVDDPAPEIEMEGVKEPKNDAAPA